MSGDLSAVLSIVVAVLALVLPGAVLTHAAGVRGFVAWSLAPVLSIGVLGVAATAAGLVGLSWGIVPLLVTLLAAAAVVLALVRGVPWLRARVGGHAPERWWAPVAGVCVAAVVGASVLWPAMGGASGFSQTFDNIFHLNAVRYILDTGNASPRHLYSMTEAVPTGGFYPAAWHGLVALVSQLTGSTVTVAANCVNLVVAMVVWPAGALALARGLRELTTFAQVAGGIVVVGFSSFPYLLLHWGVLNPNVLSYALVPSALLVLCSLLRMAVGRAVPQGSALVLAPIALAGVALAHPNGVVTLTLLGAPIFVVVGLKMWRAARRRRAGLVWLATAVGVVGVWTVLRPPAAASSWGPVESSAQAFGEALANASMARPFAVAVTACVFVGLAYLVLSRTAASWIVASWALAVVTFVVAASFPYGELRTLLVGPWYNDSFRVAAIIPLVAAPIAVVGLDHVARWADVRLRSRRASALVVRVVGAVLVGIVLVPLVITSSFRSVVGEMRAYYVVTPDSPMVDTDEYALIQRLPGVVDDRVVAVDPWNGGALAYALAGVSVTHRHVLDSPSADVDIIDQHLTDPAFRDEVCEAVRESGVRFVLDFGDRRIGGAVGDFSGLEGLAGSDVVTLVDREGAAALYEVTGCTT